MTFFLSFLSGFIFLLSSVVNIQLNHWTKWVVKTQLRWGLGWAFLERTQILNAIQFTSHFIEFVCVQVFLEHTWIFNEIQFTRHFIEFVVVETKGFVSSNVYVILTRQTCGQRASRAAWIKRQAPGNYFYDRICHTFPMSKCKGD